MEEPLGHGRSCLQSGDHAAAIRHLEEALQSPGGDSVDVRLLLAEALWQQSLGGPGSEKALPHYEAAVSLAHSAGDSSKEGMVSIGYGFALLQLGHADAARRHLTKARTLAENGGNQEAVAFADLLLLQVGAPVPTGEEAVHEAWASFTHSVTSGKPVVIFMRGTLAAPADRSSLEAAARLRAAGCRHLEVVDVCVPGANVPDGLSNLSDSVHLTLPQLYLSGAALEGWLDLPTAELRETLLAAGVALGELPTEAGETQPCHGTAAFSAGLKPWEVALVELISQSGANDWPAKAKRLSELSPPEGSTSVWPTLDVADVEELWHRLAPIVRAKLEMQVEMPCGHSCSTCPTRHDCHLHHEVEGIRDIEELAVR